MRMRFLSCLFAVLLVVIPATNKAAEQGFTVLDVNGDQVLIYRDEFGVPHIFAETNRGLFVGYGYAIAQDRLWQLELFRRASRGRLAEILGTSFPATNLGSGSPGALAVDLDIRTRLYTEDELRVQYARLDQEEAGIFQAYADGINRYINEIVAPDISHNLPFEFQYLGIGLPERWTATDVVANAVYQQRFGQVGGSERTNQTTLNALISKWGTTQGTAIFNDVRWLDDPDMPVTVPAEGAVGKRQKAPPPASIAPQQLEGASMEIEPSLEEQANTALVALGIPISSGSHTWAISPAKSASGSAVLFGGPQVDFSAPELFHEVQLRGGNGFDVTGIAFAGVPIVRAGRTDHMAWSMTTGTFGDTIDVYIEMLCSGGTGYVFNSVCTPFETRIEVINVQGALPVTCTVRRSVHGPVVFPACNLPFPSTGFVFTQKRVVWKHEIESTMALLAFNRAKNLQEFAAAAQQMEVAHNIIYADKVGNIAYFFSGKVPVRPVPGCVDSSGTPIGCDPRLPLPGTGTAEWTGEFRAMPFAINPTRGWLSNWNSKPALGYPNPDQRSFGKQYRSLEIDQRLKTLNVLSVDDMKDIEKDIARTAQGGDGRESRYLKPYLFAALDAVPPLSPLALQARAVLDAWDGSLFDRAVDSTDLAPGQVIFQKWLSLMLRNTFGDELNPQISLATTNMLIHVLDDALGGGSGVPPSRNYFAGCPFSSCEPNVIMSRTFDQALAALGTNPAAWSNIPRDAVPRRHTLYPAIPEVGTILVANRGTYAFVVVLGDPHATSESILSLGQSGFIGTGPIFDSHFMDQFELFKIYEYKPMHLFINAQLKE